MSEPKTMTSAMRQFYKQKMARLEGVSFRRGIDGRTVKISFTPYGNRHLYSDAVSRRSKHLLRSDMLDMDNIFSKAKYETSLPLYKSRKDGIVKFHYFKTMLHGSTVYINVGEQEYEATRRNGTKQTRKRYVVYSVTDRLKQKKKAKR